MKRNKKQYVKPEMLVYQMRHHVHLLNNSVPFDPNPTPDNPYQW